MFSIIGKRMVLFVKQVPSSKPKNILWGMKKGLKNDRAHTNTFVQNTFVQHSKFSFHTINLQVLEDEEEPRIASEGPHIVKFYSKMKFLITVAKKVLEELWADDDISPKGDGGESDNEEDEEKEKEDEKKKTRWPEWFKYCLKKMGFQLEFNKSTTHKWANDQEHSLAAFFSRNVFRGDIKWETIKGLDKAKLLLREEVVMPLKHRAYFSGLLKPRRGILLFGPSGTGKTMLAKAVAKECSMMFFNISASSILQRGDSERLLEICFKLARQRAPSTIFLDEIEAIISQHEASRRLRTVLEYQMDSLARTEELVFVLATSSFPWELDAAMLRRLEKRILVPLPEPESRRAIFKELLPSQPEHELPYDLLMEKTKGFSGSDIHLLCREAAMQPLRRFMPQLEQEQKPLPKDEIPKVGPVTYQDVEVALRNFKHSAHLPAARYENFNAEYGSQILQ